MFAEIPQRPSFLPFFFPTRIQENGSLITILFIAGVFWVHRLIKFIYNICCYWEIHSFYLHALRIPMVRWEVKHHSPRDFLQLGKGGVYSWGPGVLTRHWQVREHLPKIYSAKQRIPEPHS